MKHSNYNILLISLTIFLSFTFTKTSLSKQENYSVFAKLPLLGEIEVQNIKTDLTIIDDKIKYSYYVSPTKLVDFFEICPVSKFILSLIILCSFFRKCSSDLINSSLIKSKILKIV